MNMLKNPGEVPDSISYRSRILVKHASGLYSIGSICQYDWNFYNDEWDIEDYMVLTPEVEAYVKHVFKDRFV